MARPVLALLTLAAVAWTPPARAADAVLVQAYTTVGLPDRAVLRGRVAEPGLSAWLPRPADADLIVTRNLGRFLTDEVEGARVRVSVAGHTVEAVTDEDGFFRVEVALTPPLSPGRYPVELEVRARPETPATRLEGVLQVVTRAGVSVVSDFDDTLVHSNVLDRSALLANVFLRGPEDLRPVAGMASFLQCLRAGPQGGSAPHVGFHYLSASPVNLHDKIDAFLAWRRFPDGELHLRDLTVSGIGNSQAYKLAALEKIARRFPDHRLILVGDGGERDPEVYAAFRASHPDRVAAVFIHRVPGMDEDPGRFRDMVMVDDGVEAAREAASLGLLHPSCAEALAERRATALQRTRRSGEEPPTWDRPTGGGLRR